MTAPYTDPRPCLGDNAPVWMCLTSTGFATGAHTTVHYEPNPAKIAAAEAKRQAAHAAAEIRRAERMRATAEARAIREAEGRRLRAEASERQKAKAAGKVAKGTRASWALRKQAVEAARRRYSA
jgi:hypothetical protein